MVKQKDDNTYSILEKHKKTEGSTPQDDKTYNGFLSDVDGVKFLNLYEPDQDSKSYYFYKIEFSDETDGFTLYPVSDYITENSPLQPILKSLSLNIKPLASFTEPRRSI